MTSLLHRSTFHYCPTCDHDTEHEFVDGPVPGSDPYVCCRELVCRDLGTHHGRWSVVRHGGAGDQRWRLIEAFDEEAAAHALYREVLASLDQGGVRLVSPHGEIALGHWAPRIAARG